VHAHDPMHAHQPLDPLVVHRPAPVSQLRSHARLAVGAVGLVADLTDRRDQLSFLALGVGGPGRLASAPVIERRR
jgi:hypothetical protein